MAVYKRNIVDIELEQGNIHRSWLQHSIGMKDQKADHFGVRVFRNGEPVSLLGVSVQGVFMPPEGSPIAITSGNIVSGNVAEVVLPQACYNYDGQFTLAIKLVDSGNGVTDTVRIVDGMVDNTHATGTVAPTSAVPTYQEVLATYEQAITVINKSVRFDTTQSLTDGQKTTARGNIDAALAGDVSKLENNLLYYTPLQYDKSVEGTHSYNGIPRKTWYSVTGEKVNAADRACIDPILIDHSMDKFKMTSGYSYLLYGGEDVGHALTQISPTWTPASTETDISNLWNIYKYIFVVFKKVSGENFDVDEDLTDVATIRYYTNPLFYLSKLDIPFVVPQLFGAKADGETDDTEIIQECIDYAETNKKSVCLYGHYIISNTLVIPQGMTIVGNGKKTLIENTNNSVYSILIQGSNISVSNFWLKCNLGIQISDSTHRANDVQIEKLIIRTPETVFHIPNATGCVTIRDCYCMTAGTNGNAIIIGDGDLISNVGVNYVYFYNSSFESMSKSSTSGTGDNGIVIYGGQYVYFNGCDICGYKVGLNIGTRVQAISDLFFENTTFFQNRIALSVIPVQVVNMSFNNCVFVLTYEGDKIGVIGGITNLFFKECLYKYSQDIDSVILDLRNLENVVVDISGNFKTNAKKNLSTRATTLNIKYEHHYIPFITGSSPLSFTIGNKNSLMPLKKPSVIVDENVNPTITEQSNGTYLVSIPANTNEYNGFIIC